MGVRGLSSYVMSCQRACCEYIELSASGSVDVDVQHEKPRRKPPCGYRKLSAFAESSSLQYRIPLVQAEEPVRLAVDGMALVYHVMRSPGEHELHLELGCDYLALFEALRDYLVALRDAGIVPYVIVDGMQDGGKESTTLDRRRVQAVKACEIMDSIGPEHWTASDHSQRSSLLPLFAVETLTAACHSAEIYIRVAHREADPELAAACRPPRPKYASNFPTNSPRGGEDDSEGVKREHVQPAKETRECAERISPEHDGIEAAEGVRSKQSVDVSDGVGLATEQMGDGFGGGSQSVRVCTEKGDGHGGWGLGCAAVLSNDSDFMVMDIPGYIPFWSLGIGEDGSAGALVFRRRLLAARLGIPADGLADLACLLGNDWIRPNVDVQRTILEEDRLNGQGKGVGNGRRKKGKSTAKSNRNNTTHSSTPSAKELVEATGRFLSRFYRSKEGLQRRSDMDAAGIGSRSDSAALLCSRFFPGLESDPCGEGKSYPDANRSEMGTGWEGSRCGTPPVDILEGEDEVVRSKPSLADDSPALNLKRKGHRKKGSKGKGKGAGNSRKRGQPPRVLEPPAADAKDEDRIASNERGLAFLRDFKTARRHYEVPSPTRQAPVRGAFSEDVSPFEHHSGPTSPPAALAGGGLACLVGLRAGVSVPSAVTQAVLEGVFWCRVMLEDTPAPSATRPRSSISPKSRPTFGETSCAFGRLEGVRKRIYEVYLEAFAFEYPGLVVSASGKTRAEQEIGNNFDEGHTGCWPRGGGLGLDGGNEWVVTELRRVRENIRPFQVACRVLTTKGNKGNIGLNGDIYDLGRWRTCLSVLGIEGDVGHRLAECIATWLSANGIDDSDVSDARPPSGSISPALVGITLVAVLLLSTQSEQQNADMKSGGSRCRRRDGVCWEACLEADIVLAFVATASRFTEKENSERSGFPRAEGSLKYVAHGLGKRECCNIGSPAFGSQCHSDRDEIEASARKSDAQVRMASLPKETWGNTGSDHHFEDFVRKGVYGGDEERCFAEACEESLFDKEMGEGVRGDEVREFVCLWSRVQAAVWHVNTCLGVLGLLGTVRDALGYCTALNPLSLRPASALEIFLWRRKYRRMNYSCVVGEQRCRHCLSKIHDHGSEDQLREDRPCPWDRLLKGGRGQHFMGLREAYCCCWWYLMTERCRGDCNWASRMEIVLGAVADCCGS